MKTKVYKPKKLETPDFDYFYEEYKKTGDPIFAALAIGRHPHTGYQPKWAIDACREEFKAWQESAHGDYRFADADGSTLNEVAGVMFENPTIKANGAIKRVLSQKRGGEEILDVDHDLERLRQKWRHECALHPDPEVKDADKKGPYEKIGPRVERIAVREAKRRGQHLWDPDKD